MVGRSATDLRAQIWLLWAGFALVCVAALVTVVLPELTDAGEAPATTAASDEPAGP